MTISTMATPRLHRIPKEMQNPSPLMMAMMYRLGAPQHWQSQRRGLCLEVCTGLPSSFSSMSFASSLVPSIFLQRKRHAQRRKIRNREKQNVLFTKKKRPKKGEGKHKVGCSLHFLMLLLLPPSLFLQKDTTKAKMTDILDPVLPVNRHLVFAIS